MSTKRLCPWSPKTVGVSTERRIVELLSLGHHVRAWLPVKTYPISAGVKGGLAGGVAMAVLACAYGLLKVGSIWYPINLLAAVVYAEALRLGPGRLYSFHADTFAIALGLHIIVSALVGLLYGAMLPMFPRRPIVLGGLLAPVLGQGCFTRYWAWSIRCSRATSTGPGLLLHRRPSASWQGSSWFAK